MSQKDYYQILGVPKEATQDEIKQAYRNLAFKFHPDRNKDNPESNERMKEINEAYAALSDSNKRRDYDGFRERFGADAYQQYHATHSAEDIFRGSDIDQVLQEMARMFGFSNADETLKNVYGSNYRTFSFGNGPMRGQGFVFYGPGMVVGNGPDAGQVVPPAVAGPGMGTRALNSSMKWALRALGIPVPEKGKDIEDTIRVSAADAANGKEIEYYYKLERTRKLMVKVPAGTKDGQKIRLRGLGKPGKDGGETGDLYLKVSINRTLLDRIRGKLPN
jgi:DnaJ-class molecular chaperone